MAVGSPNSEARKQSDLEWLLRSSPDWEPTPFPFAVWEVTENKYEDGSRVCILRANCSTEEVAKRYMTESRVLVKQ